MYFEPRLARVESVMLKQIDSVAPGWRRVIHRDLASRFRNTFAIGTFDTMALRLELDLAQQFDPVKEGVND
jgi:hypothetical protein